MFNICINDTENTELQDLLNEVYELPGVLEFARMLLTEVDEKKDDRDECLKCISHLDNVLGGLQIYLESIRPVVDKYMWLEEIYKAQKAQDDHCGYGSSEYSDD